MKNLLVLHRKFTDNEHGFILVLAMLIMIVLIVIGVSSINTSKVELQISGNQKVHQQTFYQADSGIEIGQVVLEENLSCPNGFESIKIGNPEDNATQIVWLTNGSGANSIVVYDPKFALSNRLEPAQPYPSDTERDIKIPSNALVPGTIPYTNLKVFGTTSFATGAAIQMSAGYEGKGKSAAGGGATIDYELHSQRKGYRNSESVIAIDWKHRVGQEGNCEY